MRWVVFLSTSLLEIRLHLKNYRKLNSMTASKAAANLKCKSINLIMLLSFSWIKFLKYFSYLIFWRMSFSSMTVCQRSLNYLLKTVAINPYQGQYFSYSDVINNFSMFLSCPEFKITKQYI